MGSTPHTISGYDYGDPHLPHSPVTLPEVDRLKSALLWRDDDDRALREAGDVLADQVTEIVDAWYGYVGSHPHLAAYFAPPGGEPDHDYLERVRPRFEQWILDTCRKPHDQAWLDYQNEIALRHTRAKKNETDHARAVDLVPLRYMIAFINPITTTIRPFLARKGHEPDDVDRMHQAWFKAVVLDVALWSRAYTDSW
ncbi:protoglobin domain-containing protein [Saccharopolyspora indica]|uniref:protoglobin domain-containing protein n=1 Tax=Saccharopolyspora indica TaxID=1229659 RepID=UPI0022EAC7D5|nr:protoglobin domain-containing protein [Saccharopolyspora indica]MDA3645255.1 protoglobin domain-containing protein [Saccharopolyspora indica]